MTDDWPLPDHDSGDSQDDASPETPPPPVPPPEVWEFYRTQGRWPGPLEA
jgi:hypothetical protein